MGIRPGRLIGMLLSTVRDYIFDIVMENGGDRSEI
jgi:hypothetical protein